MTNELRLLVAGDHVHYGDDGSLRPGIATAVHDLQGKLQVVVIDGKTVMAVECVDRHEVVAGPVDLEVARSLAKNIVLGRDPHLGTSLQFQVLALALVASGAGQ